MAQILIAKSDDEIRACYSVVVQLRPSYSEVEFVSQIKKQNASNYYLAYIKKNNKVCSVAGYRFSENLAWGKFLYVDDLITDSEERSNGYGKVMLEWLIEQAKEHDCAELHLDSGVQRLDAHRFYQRENMLNTSLHYAIKTD